MYVNYLGKMEKRALKLVLKALFTKNNGINKYWKKRRNTDRKVKNIEKQGFAKFEGRVDQRSAGKG